MTRRYSRYTDEEIVEAIEATINFTEAAELLGINRKTVQRVAWERDIESAGGRRIFPDKVLGKIRQRRTPHIMRYVKRHKLLPYFCVKCGLDGSWQGAELVLQLDHVDGDPLNNKLENLRWMCPNCHSQTETFCGRNANK